MVLREFFVECAVELAASRASIGFSDINTCDRDSRLEKLREHPIFLLPRQPGEGRGIPDPGLKLAGLRSFPRKNQKSGVIRDPERHPGEWQILALRRFEPRQGEGQVDEDTSHS